MGPGEEREKEKEVFKRAEHAWGGGGSGNLIYQLVNFFFLTFRPRKTKHEDSHFRSFTGKIARNYSLCCRGSGLWKKLQKPPIRVSHSAVGVGNGGCGPVRAVRCCRMFLAAKTAGHIHT